MCQLTYSNLHDQDLNKLAVYCLSKIGSARHDDGCGFICEDNSIWKSEIAANKILNLGEILNLNVQSNAPLPFHIRMATWGIEVKKENSHPFEGKHYILMHNGTLLPRNGEEPKDKTKDSDSLKFLKTLDEYKDKKPDGAFPDIFNEAMSNFAGKFAFIIREKETNVDYIVRGKTAELWISYVKFNDEPKGYVVNTSKETMKEAFDDFINIWDLFYAETVQFSEPKLIDLETIYVAEYNDVRKIGKTVEFTPKKEEKAIVPATRGGHSNWRGNNYWDNYDADADAKEILQMAKKVHTFLEDHCMALIDLQMMFMISAGLSVLEVTKEDIEFYENYVIPKISANKTIRARVKSILNGQYFPHDVYIKYNLEYPWTVNDGDKVIKALEEYTKSI